MREAEHGLNVPVVAFVNKVVDRKASSSLTGNQ